MTILFGLDVSTSAAPGADPVAEAARAERLGFDFVSATDHPGAGHPNFELWTLLTWIAARTERIRVATRVLAVPLRPPALVAKAAESLARLSGGRLVLGLGAGGSEEELRSYGAAAGGPRERIDGLVDAVRIIRGLWSQPETTHEGAAHRVESARLEPKPAHPIPLWLGTFGPRALEVTGRYADGWIPSFGYVAAGQLPAMRAQVRAAAEAVGRDPDELTCALNVVVTLGAEDESPFTGSPERVAEGLLRHVGLGFTAFNVILHGDDVPAQAELLAGEVLPVVRSAA